MTNCFPKCRDYQKKALLAGIIAGLAGMLLTSLRYGLPAGVVVALLIVIICKFFGNSAAVKYAATEHQRLLNILYQEADAQRFLLEYKEIPDRCKKGSAEQLMARNYLASAYAAMGDFRQAIALLENLDARHLKTYRVGLTALIHSNLCQFALWMDNRPLVEEQYAILEKMAAEHENRNSVVSNNLKHNLDIYREYLCMQRGEPVDTDILVEELGISNSPLHRANIQLLLARVALRDGAPESARPFLEECAEQYPGLYAGVQARELLDSLGPGVSAPDAWEDAE